MPTKTIKNLKELQEVSQSLAKTLKIPQVVLLKGPLAVGKTQMLKYMAEALGFSKKDIHSPTFSLINLYQKNNKTPIYHVDLYRLTSEKELESTAFWDIFYEDNLVFIEWPDLIAKKLPPLWNKMFIEIQFHKDHRILKWN